MKRQRAALATASICLVLAAVLLVQYGKPFASSSLRKEAKKETVTAMSSGKQAPSRSQAASRHKIVESYGRLPLSFEANRGQVDSQVKFLSRGNGSTIFLTSTEAVLALRNGAAQPSDASRPLHGQRETSVGRKMAPQLPGLRRPLVLRMKLVGANPEAQIAGSEPLPGRSNYFTGRDPAKWHTNVPHFARVKYRGIYPGVDLVYYGNQRQLEYDFVVAPGGDPSRIELAVSGAEKVHVDSHGDLVLWAAGQEVRWRKPVMYQPVAGSRQEVSGGYVEKANHVVGFAVGPYDASQPLVIDPVLAFSTALGGNDSDRALGIALDAAGDIYVTGVTSSFGFPTTPGAFQSQFPSQGPLAEGEAEAGFVTKIKADGSALLYSTFLAGGLPTAVGQSVSVGDGGSAIAVDSAGNAYVTGFTFSSAFPTTPGAVQTTFGGGICQPASNSACSDAFVTKLNPTGSGLVYSTFLGGNGADSGHGIAVDAAGNAYVTGDTKSVNFPTTGGAFQIAFGGGTEHVFVAKLNPSGSALAYSTYLGGDRVDESGGIAVDSTGNAYVTGSTTSFTFPMMNAFQPRLHGDRDAFVTKLDPAGSALVYSTYLGGKDLDDGRGIALDAAGNAYVTGETFSGDFPLANPFQPTRAGCVLADDDCNDAFVTKLNVTGTALVYSTFLGGQFGEGGAAIAVDSSGNTYVTGFTGSPEFPTANAIQKGLGGALDVFVTELNDAGSALVFSTFLGGTKTDEAHGLAVDSAGNVYVVGRTFSNDFPVANPLQPTRASSDLSDAFVVKIGSAADFSLSAPSGASATIAAGQPATYTLSLAGSNGFDGMVSFTCNGNAPAAACSVSPSSIMLSGTNAVTATVSVTTTAPHAFLPPGWQHPMSPPHPSLPVATQWLLFVLTLTVMLSSLWGQEGLRRRAWAGLAGVVLFAALSFGCGGASPSPPSSSTQTLGTPSGVYTLVVTATSGATSHSMNLSLTVN